MGHVTVWVNVWMDGRWVDGPVLFRVGGWVTEPPGEVVVCLAICWPAQPSSLSPRPPPDPSSPLLLSQANKACEIARQPLVRVRLSAAGRHTRLLPSRQRDTRV